MRIAVIVASAGILLTPAAHGGGYDDYQDGTAGAKLGTLMYNSLNPDKLLPMPQNESSAIGKTFQHIGEGNSLKDSFNKASKDASGNRQDNK